MNKSALNIDNRSVVKHHELLDELIKKDPNEPRVDQHDSPLQTQEAPPSHQGNFRKQVRAILRKNISLQAKQVGTNCCQVFTPIVCLLFTLLVKILAEANLGNFFSYELGLPWIYNVPYKKIYGNNSIIFSNRTSPLNFTSCLQWYLYDFAEGAKPETMDFIGNDEDGMLSHKFPPVDMIKNLYDCNGTLMPYFKRPNDTLTINKQLYDTQHYLDKIDFTPPEDVPELFLLPDGAVTFYEANPHNLTIKLQMNDLRVQEYHRSNGVSRYRVMTNPKLNREIMTTYEGYMILFDMMSRAFIQSTHDDTLAMSGSLVMPATTNPRYFLELVINTSAVALYPIALSLLLPVFMQAIVLEKEERLREIMKMNGLKMTAYWLVNYFWCLTIYVIAVLIFLSFGYFVLDMAFFTNTNFWVLFWVLLGWGLCQVSLSFFYQNFLSNSKTAMIVGYLLSLWSAMAGATFASAVFQAPKPYPLPYRLYPPFSFGRLIYYMAFKCNDLTCYQSFSEFNDEMWSCLIIVYVSAVVFLVLGLYLDAVLPQEYGIRKHPLFFLKSFFKIVPSSSSENKKPLLANNSEQNIPIDFKEEDEEVQKERAYIDQLSAPYRQHPLIIKNMRKVYKAIGGKPPKVAVNNFSLHIERGEMFGLLGPNGAGKTSLISMLTGLYPPEKGSAWVGGFDIRTEIENVHTQMGVCPQFDLLWPDLTVEEHLFFFARIRGVPADKERPLVDKALREVYLTKFASFQTKQLSGGMKRRLSVAIALVGDPKIIFLDEPTTGLDPENRRQLWDILTEAKGNRAIVLTTHSMEEADVLCSRIGIITDGVLRCLGQQNLLKSKYGGGYHLFINCHKENYFLNECGLNDQSHSKLADECWLKLQKYISQLLPNAELKSSFNGNFIYLVPLEGLEVSKLFDEIESKRKELNISDWGISQSTLEDVFMEIVESHESAAARDSIENQ